MRVFHGTTQERLERTLGILTPESWVTTDKEDAEFYAALRAKEYGETAKVVEVEIPSSRLRLRARAFGVGLPESKRYNKGAWYTTTIMEEIGW